MEKFIRLEGAAAPMPDDNIDTDIIYPARFLLLMDRAGLGRYAFHDKRFAADDGEHSGYVLNRPPFRNASALVAGANFGCGSSREQAVWALLGYGIRCVIAPSFGDIFFNNCGKNGLLALRLPQAEIDSLSAQAAIGAHFIIDLPSQTIRAGDLGPIRFEIDAEMKAALLNGWDEADRILNDEGDKIDAFEQCHRRAQPWLFAPRA